MKILMIFVDMLRNELALCKEKNGADSKIISMCRQIGGVIYESCYTTAPDTYRSLGSFWSSQYPNINGCNNRNKKTFDFLKEPNNSLMGILKNNEYNLQAFVGGWKNEKVGIFPNSYDLQCDNLSTGKFLNDFLDTVKLTDNSLLFFNLEDLHFILDDGGYTQEAYNRGIKKITELINHIFTKFTKDMFDEIIIFSDHGFHFCFEQAGESLDERRSNIFLFWHHKGDEKLTFDTEIRSIMDVYPTILDCCDIAYDREKIQGKSLYESKGHLYLAMEDHASFYASYLQPVNRWAVVDSRGIHYIDEECVWKDSNGTIEKTEYNRFLEETATGFSEMNYIRKKNLEYSISGEKVFEGHLSDGVLRRKESLSILQKARQKILKYR